MAYFIALCGDSARSGSLLLRQFVTSLDGPAFQWYSRLEPNSIPDWPTMEREFLLRFYDTQRSVSIAELTQTKQEPRERAADFITRWRNLSIRCSQVLQQHEAVKLCMGNLHSHIAFILHGTKPIRFEDFAFSFVDHLDPRTLPIGSVRGALRLRVDSLNRRHPRRT